MSSGGEKRVNDLPSKSNPIVLSTKSLNDDNCAAKTAADSAQDAHPKKTKSASIPNRTNSELAKLLAQHYQTNNVHLPTTTTTTTTTHDLENHNDIVKEKPRRKHKSRRSEELKHRVSHLAAERAKKLVIETQAMTFYACITVVSLFFIMIFCISLSILDLEKYNFALYYTLLCLVGIMLACAFCIAHPKACPNPKWYNRCCTQVMELYQEPANVDDPSSVTQTPSQLPHLRATAFMLSPAMHVMQSMWKGMAWVASGIEEEETHDNDTSTYHGTVDTHLELGSTILDLTSTLVGEEVLYSTPDSSGLLPVIEEDESSKSHSQIVQIE